MNDRPIPASNSSETKATRREFLAGATSLAISAAMGMPRSAWAQAETKPRFRMKACLTPGSIGVRANQLEAIDLAERYGFEAVEPYGGYLASLSDEELAALVAKMQSKGLAWGAAGLPADFRGDAETFAADMKELPKIAAALARAGAERVGTWLMPGSNELTYLKNLRRHARRLGEVARVLADHGQRLGLEYIGTRTLQSRFRYPFVHTLAETLNLIAETGAENVGLVLDSWHWWQAGDTVEEIAALNNEQVVSVDLNDAPEGVPKNEQQDGRRELPSATGVIDVGAFLGALVQIGYNGPVRAEPFNETLNALENDAACEAVIASLRASFEPLR